MHIKQKISQYRRDFLAVFECEHCGAQERRSGYDDAYFHEEVIPGMACTGCGRKGTSAMSSPDVPAEAVL